MEATTLKALLRHNNQVPRYTSYPTAPHFSDAVDGKTVTSWLSTLESDTNLSLYFHVPFCKKICWYCGCHTKATEKYDPVASFVSYLKKEIELTASKLSASPSVTHIHFGGGSPSYLQPDDFSDIMNTVRKHFKIAHNCEIAIEMDPREITEPKVAAYAQAGVNRASLGVQDFHKDTQKAINRLQPLHVVFECVSLLRSYEINNISVDLLYGLPHQTIESIRENVRIAAGLSPERISLFGYAHVPWMKKHMQLINEDSLPDGKQRLLQFEAARKALLEKSYIQIGLDHFVQPQDSMALSYLTGDLKRNFQGYTTDKAPALIGFGPSAISSVPQGYYQNTPNNRDYYRALDEGKLHIAKGLELSEDDKARRAIIEHIMCYQKIDVARFCLEHGINHASLGDYMAELAPLIADGLVEMRGTEIRIKADAAQVSRIVCAAFDAYIQPQAARHSQVA